MMSSSTCLASRDSSPTEFKVQRPLLTTSILGRFVRRCRVEYIKLDYDEAELLWNLFKASRAPALEYLDIDDQNSAGRKSGIESFEGPIGNSREAFFANVASLQFT